LPVRRAVDANSPGLRFLGFLCLCFIFLCFFSFLDSLRKWFYSSARDRLCSRYNFPSTTSMAIWDPPLLHPYPCTLVFSPCFLGGRAVLDKANRCCLLIGVRFCGLFNACRFFGTCRAIKVIRANGRKYRQ